MNLKSRETTNAILNSGNDSILQPLHPANARWLQPVPSFSSRVWETVFRLTVLEALYTQRRLEPTSPGIFLGEFERLIGRPREHLEFTIWFLIQKKFVERGDNSRLVLTVEGAEYLEQSYRTNLQQKRLKASSENK